MAEYAQYNWHGTSFAQSDQEEGPTIHHKDLNQAVQAIRALIPTRPDVGFIRTDDEFILRFLHARKFDVNESFSLFVNYYVYRQKNKHLFLQFNVRESGIRQALCDGFPGILPQRDHHGRCVLVFFTSNWDHSRYNLLSIYRALLLSLEHLVEESSVQQRGLVVIVDWSEFSFRQSAQLSPSVLRLMIEGLQDCFPARFKGVHFVGQPWYVEAALAVIRPFLKDKTRAKIFLHGNNLSTLHAHVSQDILPAELGGEGPSYHSMTWAQRLLDAQKETGENSNGVDGEVDMPVDKNEQVGKWTGNGEGHIRKSETFPATSFPEG